jgi:hypothetical protein
MAQLMYKARPKGRAQCRTINVNAAPVTFYGGGAAIMLDTSVILGLATARDARIAMIRSGRVLRIIHGGGSKKKQQGLLQSRMLARAVGYAAIQPKEFHELRTENGIRYPLRHPLDVALRKIGESARAYLPETDALHSLAGEGNNYSAAIKNFAAGFHRLVETHWRKPAHLQTQEDEAINRVLNNLIDWNRFRQINPIEQPLWGKVLGWLPRNRIAVRWFIGPNEERDKEAVLTAKEICSGLLAIPVGHWFYGAGKVYPTRIRWTQSPVEVPDPSDRHAIEQAWDLIPRKVLAEAGAWPLREE